MRTVILPARCAPQLEDVPEDVRRALAIVFVESAERGPRRRRSSSTCSGVPPPPRDALQRPPTAPMILEPAASVQTNVGATPFPSRVSCELTGPCRALRSPIPRSPLRRRGAAHRRGPAPGARLRVRRGLVLQEDLRRRAVATTAVRHRVVAANGGFARDLYVDELVTKVLEVRIGGKALSQLSTRYGSRVLGEPSRDPRDAELRRAILAELGAVPRSAPTSRRRTSPSCASALSCAPRASRRRARAAWRSCARRARSSTA